MRVEEGTFTSVQGTGIVSMKYDSVRFTVRAQTKGKDGEKAQAGLTSIANAVQHAIDRCTLRGSMVDRSSVRSSVSLLAAYVHKGEGFVANGYVAKYQLSFRCDGIEHASEIYNDLTAIAGLEVLAPEFRVKDIKKFQGESFRRAIANVRERFASECAVLGLDATCYDIQSYQSHYDESEAVGSVPATAYARSTLGESSPGHKPEPIVIDPGQASVSVRVIASFVRKGVPIGGLTDD